MNTTELRRRRFFDALARVLVFALFIVLFVAAVVLAPAALLTGCAAPGELPPDAIDFVTNAAQRAVVVLHEARDPATTSTEEHEELGEGAQASSDSPSSPSSPVLVFKYGGFDGSKAVEDPRCRLSSPTITADSIRYKWESGAPSDWARNKTESGNLVIAAAFFWDEDAKKWVGGKFEWTDESRSSRDCQNIYEGYGGWEAAAWEYAKKRAFCVLSADGKFRSNLLEETR